MQTFSAAWVEEDLLLLLLDLGQVEEEVVYSGKQPQECEILLSLCCVFLLQQSTEEHFSPIPRGVADKSRKQEGR